MEASVILTSRVFDFPIGSVYAAWANPDYLSKWWGPSGFTNTFHEFDFRVGGTWRFTMHGADKGHYENLCKFTQIIDHQAIAWKRISKPLFDVRATFEELSPGKTKVGFKMIFDTVEACNKLRPYVTDKNEENFDRLEALLQSMETKCI